MFEYFIFVAENLQTLDVFPISIKLLQQVDGLDLQVEEHLLIADLQQVLQSFDLLLIVFQLSR